MVGNGQALNGWTSIIYIGQAHLVNKMFCWIISGWLIYGLATIFKVFLLSKLALKLNLNFFSCFSYCPYYRGICLNELTLYSAPGNQRHLYHLRQRQFRLKGKYMKNIMKRALTCWLIIKSLNMQLSNTKDIGHQIHRLMMNCRH